MGSKKCVICNEEILEEFQKLKGTVLRVVNENKKREFLYVCSNCQKTENWIEKAKVKGA